MPWMRGDGVATPRVARRAALLQLQQRYKRTYANDLGPYPVPLTIATVSTGVVGALLAFGIGLRLPLVATVVITVGLSALPLREERVQEQWTWTAWLGTVVGSAAALGLVAAATVARTTRTGWLPWLLAIALPVLVIGSFAVRNAPHGNRWRLGRLLALCVGCLAAIVMAIVAVRIVH